MSRIRDLQQFLGHIRVVPHHRDEHGRLVVLVHSFRQAGLRVYQLERELPVPAADGVVQRVEPVLVLRQDPCASFPRSCRTRLRPGDVGGLSVILVVVV
jgi:hypothetical protein